MNLSPTQWIARARSIRLALNALASIESHVLLILPSTRRALALARELCNVRHCSVVAGPVSDDPQWQFGARLRTPGELAQAYAGQPELPSTIIAFPDQLAGIGNSFVWHSFLGALHTFSAIEALLVLRHRPRVFGLQTLSTSGDFALTEILYGDLLNDTQPSCSLQALLGRLLGPLGGELATPPRDWLAGPWFARKSIEYWRTRLCEELKDVECLLRLHLLSPACDRLCAGTAVAAVVARQKYLLGAISP